MEGTTSVLCTERMGQVMKASERQYWKVKRGMDILLSLALIVVCSPVMLLIALLIVLDDPHTGPVFKQTRFGLRGKPFTMYKFRTMVADAESRLEELLSLIHI